MATAFGVFATIVAYEFFHVPWEPYPAASGDPVLYQKISLHAGPLLLISAILALVADLLFWPRHSLMCRVVGIMPVAVLSLLIGYLLVQAHP
jgi:hypothetical protein